MRLTPAGLAKGLFVLTAVLIITRYGGPQSHASMVVKTLAQLVMVFSLLWLPGQALLWSSPLRDVDEESLYLLSTPLTILCYGGLFALLFSLSAPALVYRGVFSTCAALTALVVLRRLLLQGEIRIPVSLIFSALLATCALCFVCIGLTHPWKEMVWQVPATRGLHEMPIDNNLQFMTAEAFLHGTEPWVIPGEWTWTMGDRPPLLGVLSAVFAKGFLLRKRFTYFDYTVVGIVLNSLFAAPIIHLCTRLLENQRAAILTTISLVLTPYIFLNVYFTWPKTAAAFFSLSALAVFVSRKDRDGIPWSSTTGAVALGALLGLSALCHGVALLSMPLILLAVVFFSPGKRTARAAISSAVVGTLTGLAVYCPWHFYKASHVQLQKSALLAHYLPYRDRPEDTVSIAEWVASTTWGEQLDVRWAHLAQVVPAGDFQGTYNALITGSAVTYHRDRWPLEFFQAVSQVGEQRIVLGVTALTCLLALVTMRRLRVWVSRAGTFYAIRCASLLALALVSYLLNVFAKWLDIAPHTLPMLELMLAMVCMTCALFACSRWLSAFLLLTVAHRFLDYCVACTFARALPVDLYALGVLVSAVGMFWLSIRDNDARIQEGGVERSSTTAK